MDRSGWGPGGRRFESWTTEFRVVDTVEQPTSPAYTLATFVVENGRPGAQLAGTPAA